MSTYSTSAAVAASSSKSLSETALPPRTLARVSREIRDLMKNAPEGTKLILDPETGMPPSLSEIMAEIKGPTGTPYADRYFQLKLVLPSDFPNSAPRGFFLTKIYHPNVDMSTGAICVNTLKRDWSPDVKFAHVLGVIRCLLIVPFPESSLNDEAGKLFMESYEEYARRAKLMANVHGRTASSGELSPGSPLKNSKENEGENMNTKVKSSSISSSTVLKQSNSSDRNSGDAGTAKKAKSMKSSSKGAEKKSKKKKNLKRL